MIFSFKNLLHILRRYKTASILNLLGLSVAFTAFILIAMHVRYEYTYNQFPHQNRIFRFEYFRDSLQWEPNFSRPAAELMLTASPHIEAGGLLRVNLPVPFYITTEHDTLQQGIRASIERITPGFAQVFDFKILEGSASSLHNIDQVLIPQSLARKLFGTESAIGQTLKIEEFGSEGAWYDSPWGAQYPTRVTVGGVYQDFPSNSLVANHIYGKQDPRELISDWHMGVFYCYLKLDSPQSIDEILQNYLTRYPSEAGGDHMKAVRLRCVDELYFGEYISNDYVPHGNKTITDILLLIALLVILIASINFVNFSVALTPLRIKGINTQKVLVSGRQAAPGPDSGIAGHYVAGIPDCLVLGLEPARKPLARFIAGKLVIDGSQPAADRTDRPAGHRSRPLLGPLPGLAYDLVPAGPGAQRFLCRLRSRSIYS